MTDLIITVGIALFLIPGGFFIAALADVMRSNGPGPGPL